MTNLGERETRAWWIFAFWLTLGLLAVFIYMNICHMGYAQQVSPDLSVRPNLLTDQPPPYHVTQKVVWTIEIGNNGAAIAENCTVRVFLGIPDVDRKRMLCSTSLPYVGEGGVVPVQVEYTFAAEDYGLRVLSAEVDFGNNIIESEEDNNHRIFQIFWVAPDPNSRPPDGEITLGVLNFGNNLFNDKDHFEILSKAIADMLTERLDKVQNLKLVERQYLDFLVDELNLHAAIQEGEVSAEDKRRLAKLVGAQALCFGSFMDDPFSPDGKWHFHARVDIVEKAVIVSAGGITREKKDFHKMVEDLAEKIAANLGEELQLELTGVEGIGQSVDVYSAEALQLYRSAVEYLKAGQEEDAIDKLKEALKDSRDFIHAAELIESVRGGPGGAGPERGTTHARSWAVIIGIDEYSMGGGFDQLRYAVKDAKAVETLLIESFGFKRENVKSFYNEDATRQNLLGIFDHLSKVVRKEDRLLVFYAGHGEDERIPGSLPLGFIVPVNGNKGQLHATCIPMREIGLIVHRVRARNMLFILDACYAGIAGYEGIDFIPSLVIERGCQIMTAGGLDQQAQAGAKFDGHGVYTYFLLQGLQGEADCNKNGIITLYELQAYLETRVKEASKNQQTPQLRSVSGNARFVFCQENN